jgi:hypothetical protein
MEVSTMASGKLPDRPTRVLADLYAGRFDALAAKADDNTAPDEANIQVLGGWLVCEAYSVGLLWTVPGLKKRTAWAAGDGPDVESYSPDDTKRYLVRNVENLLPLVERDLEAAGLITTWDPHCLRPHPAGGYVLRPNLGRTCRAIAALLRGEAVELDRSRGPGAPSDSEVAERRKEVAKLLSQFTQGEVAERLGISKEIVKADRKWLRGNGRLD